MEISTAISKNCEIDVTTNQTVNATSNTLVDTNGATNLTVPSRNTAQINKPPSNKSLSWKLKGKSIQPQKVNSISKSSRRRQHAFHPAHKNPIDNSFRNTRSTSLSRPDHNAGNLKVMESTNS